MVFDDIFNDDTIFGDSNFYITGAADSGAADSGESSWGKAWDWLTSGSSGSNLALGLGGAGIAQLLGANDAPAQKPAGYQGGIPNYTYNRQQIQYPANDPNRRPGSAGRRYFTDGTFTGGGTLQGAGLPQTGGAAGSQLAAGEPAPSGNGGGGTTDPDVVQYAEGGIASAMPKKEGRYLRGETDGMADEISTTIDGEDPAALSDGEFVIPADIVSHLGNGNSEAGAKVLEQMMAKVRKARTGNDKQGKEINPDDFLPV